MIEIFETCQTKSIAKQTNRDESLIIRSIIPLKNTSKAHKQQIESIIYQIRAKIYSTRNNEYEIEYNEARIRLHLLNVVKLVKEDRKSARIAINLVEELENVIIRELQET